ncbi:hypothetical protein [Corynebacterium mustelae]|uniref:hypothetical protein n=1 Tax=Corynebacterium mustelae TaxID=571915 RepID=UPI00130D9AB4|nr:hypothetical protein [Corynebacterium mustelae]
MDVVQLLSACFLEVGDCGGLTSFGWDGRQVVCKSPTCRSVWVLVDAASVACGLGLLCRFLEVGDCGVAVGSFLGF